MIDISVDDLKKFFSYDPLTGIIVRKLDVINAKAGDVAGFKDGQGYLHFGFRQKYLMAHRVAFALHHGRWPEKHIDHINRDKSDNRISNLREATRKENLRNTEPRKNTKSGYKGVRKDSPRAWKALITVNSERVCVGQYKTGIEAALAYDEAARKYYGEFACTNFSKETQP